MREARIALPLLTVFLSAALLIGAARADTSNALGDRSGEGSTPFTGIAQAPEANLFTGALNTAIPIDVPPGRRGMTPQLALQYSSNGGPTPFGVGWDVPIGHIERSTTWGTPRCTGPHTDDFVLALPTGASALVREAPGSNFYRPKVEQAYVRAELLRTQNSWVVFDRSGLKYTFGDVDSARVGNSTPLTLLATAADGSCQLTTLWALTRVEDPNGNTIDVTWAKVFNVLYPVTVRYGGSTRSGAPPHTYTVRFRPEWRAPEDRIFSHHNGVAARLVWRIYAIDVETDLPAPGTLVRSYGLQYRDHAPGASADGYQALLSAVTVTGRPTQHLVYTPSVTQHRATAATFAKPSATYGALRVANDSLEVSQTVLDMNGDGRLDLVRSDDPPTASWAVYWGTVDANGTFSFSPTATAWQAPGNWLHLRNVWTSTGACAGNDWRCTASDTFDITGDGIPDFVDASNPTTWIVYKGRGVPQWGFDNGVAWPAPNRQFIRRIYQQDTYQDVVDMNGDGRPDLVVSGAPGQGPGPYQWDVYINTGAGFEPARLPMFPARVNTLVDHWADGLRHMLVDFNGDGLPDLVRTGHSLNGPLPDWRCQPSATALASCLEVSFNTGQGFQDPPTLIPVPLSTAVQTTDLDADVASVVQDLFDVNGDGLPDWVYLPVNLQTGQYVLEWRVLLNLGGTLEALTYEPSPTQYTEGIASRIWSGGSTFLRQSVGTLGQTDLLDVNGDGFLDQITAQGTTWRVRLHNAHERPNLLGMMDNGLGGTNTVVYRPSTVYDNTGGDAQPDLPFITWVVDKTRQTDGQCTAPPGANLFQPGAPPANNPCIDSGNELISTFAYQDGRFDPIERELRGFRRVVRTRAEGSAATGNQTVTYFGQDVVTKGRILQVDTYGGSTALVRSEINGWGSRTAGPNRTQIWLRETRRIGWDLLTSGTPQYATTITDPPDAYGNVTHHYSTGLFGAALVDTRTTYATPQAGWQVYDRPSNVRITDATGSVLEEKWLYYDGSGADGLALGAVAAGNLKRVRNRLSSTDPNGPEMRMAYDTYGNLTGATDANGQTTTTVYDARALYPVSVINPLGHTSVTVVDYRWGQPLFVRDPNNAVTLYDYDSAGRRTCTARPGDTLSTCSSTATYHFAAAPGELSWVELAERQDAPHPPLTTRQYFDALGRPRYTDTFRVVDGAPTTVRSNHVVYDPAGRVKTLHHPYLVSAGSPNDGATTYDYHLNGSAFQDPLGRVFRTTNADGTSRRTEYVGILTRSYDEEGQRTEVVADPFGRITMQTVYSGDAPYTVTQRGYDALGRLLTIRQNGVLLRTLGYDVLGRKTQMVDQDSGTWRYGYDGVGNLRWQDDPQPNRHVEFCYDAINNPTRRCTYPADFQTPAACTSACSDAEAIVYRYGETQVPYSKGRLTAVDDASGLTQIDEYDQRGRQRKLTRTIDLSDGSRHARFEFTYDTNDRIASTKYPDGEIVFTEYDDAGQPIALRNQANTFFVTDARYDLFGRAARIDHANGVIDTRAYGGAADQHRLLGLAATKGSVKYLDLGYVDYSDRGLLAQIVDGRNPSGELSNSASFTYDPLGRLTNFDSVHAPLDSVFAYDTMGNLTRRGDRYLRYDNPAKPHQATSLHIGSPTAPAISIAHDADGNRAAKGSQQYTYDTNDRLAEVNAGGAAVRFVYDYRGRQAAKIVTTTSAVRTRFYSELAETTAGTLTKWYFLGPLRVASQTTTYVGWETAALDHGSVWLAAGSLEHPTLVVVLAHQASWVAGTVLLCLGVGVLAVPWRRRPVVGIAVRPAQAIVVALACVVGTLPWPIAFQPAPAEALGGGGAVIRHIHLDHLGSTQVITDSGGNIVEQIRYLPYGSIRAHWDRNNVIIANPGDGNRREFGGYMTEPLSGLQYAGARFYDPDLGSFLTHDPATQFASPYSYGGGDPVNWSDPTGTDFLIPFIISLLVTALVSAAVNTVIAAAQGLPLSAIGRAALGGAIAGAAGVGLGVVAGAATLGAASLAGTLSSSVTLSSALDALGEVAARSAFSTTIANAAGQVSSASGAPSELTMALQIIVGIVASVGYDQFFPGKYALDRVSQGTTNICSTTADHTNITVAAAEDAGFNDTEVTTILDANLGQDLDVLNNETHFDFAAQRAFAEFSNQGEDLIRNSKGLMTAETLKTLGKATHHLQDQFALGHMVPGTSAFKGASGAIPRFIIHNVVGGEVAFRQASYDATRQFLGSMHDLVNGI